VGQDKSMFEELYLICKNEDPKFNHRASWVLNHIVENYPELIDPYASEIVIWLENQNSSTQRNMLRALTFVKLQEDDFGRYYDLCLNLVLDQTRDVAVKVHAMEIASRIVLEYPDLKNEFMDTIEQFYEESSVAYQARVRKIRKKMNRKR